MNHGQEPVDVVAGAPAAEMAERERTSCPECGATAQPGDLFCEACGTPLGNGVPAPAGATRDGGSPASGQAPGEPAPESPAAESSPADGAAPADPAAPPDPAEGPTAAPAAAPCAECGGTIAADGYCELCGSPATRERDHWTEQPAAWVAAVCDRGIRHAHNEDATALAADSEPDSFAALVVCDGVSTAIDSDVASLAAARAARDALAAYRPAEGTPSERVDAWTRRLADATGVANRAVTTATAADPAADPAGSAGSAGAGPGNAPAGLPLSPPSCTFVAVVLDGQVLVCGWVGDSRAYWLPDDGDPMQLSIDDSWATAAVELGIPRELAERNPQAHAITRWLGPDSPDYAPRCSNLRLDRQGWVLVCSDGLWNYCSPAGELRALVADSVGAVGSDPAALAAELVAWANRQGGHDNITVALARVTPGGEDVGEGAAAPEVGVGEPAEGMAPEPGAEKGEQGMAPEPGA